MNTQAIASESIACLGRAQRRALMQAWNSQVPPRHATEFHQGMHLDVALAPEQSLPKHRILALPESKAILECLSGRLWLTREGDGNDYFLDAGESMSVAPEDGAVVQALWPSRVRWLAD
ncbi:MAG: DUF2917 domain-containing protein [Sulfuritalea sp.]|nr:DUF2917 domain-containing protein [Sulfuritalea sp.]